MVWEPEEAEVRSAVQEAFLESIDAERLQRELKGLEIRRVDGGGLVVEQERDEAFVRFDVGSRVDCSLRMSTAVDSSRWDSVTVFDMTSLRAADSYVRFVEDVCDLFRSEYCFKEILVALSKVPFSWKSEGMHQYHLCESWIDKWKYCHLMTDLERVGHDIEKSRKVLENAQRRLDACVEYPGTKSGHAWWPLR